MKFNSSEFLKTNSDDQSVIYIDCNTLAANIDSYSDTMAELVSSYLVFSHRVGSGVITAKVDKDRKISGGVDIFR